MAPLAPNVVDAPAHIATLLPALTFGNGFTFTVTEDVFTQPLPSVPITVYAVVLIGVATGLTHVLHDNVLAGVHT